MNFVYKLLLSLIMIILQPLYAINKTVGFDDVTLKDFHPGLGAILKQSMVLENMRFAGPYGPKILAQNSTWRHKMFESAPSNVNYMTVVDNSCQYPSNAIAAFIQ